MPLLSRVVGTVVACVTAVLNYLTDAFLTAPLKAPKEHLEEARLTTLSAEKRSFKAKTLWANSGAVIMAEAAELSSLKPQLDELGVPLYAVVKEDVGTERRFYGPRERKMGLLAFLRVGVWANGLRAFRNGFMGNVFGEGFILGGVYVLGPGQQGILLEHREIEFGDKVNILDVLKAARRIPQELVVGDGLLMGGKGSPGGTRTTTFSFLGSQKAGYRGSRNSALYSWMSTPTRAHRSTLSGVSTSLCHAEKGILLEHREIEFGDKVNILDVLKAARRIPQELKVRPFHCRHHEKPLPAMQLLPSWPLRSMLL
ncbi:hypothetical protein CRUP_033279 [Coryphaenoides rupestris]|nr:hypothetical protein CRUP_033279 [Coryphaenoides rupestris]